MELHPLPSCSSPATSYEETTSENSQLFRKISLAGVAKSLIFFFENFLGIFS